MPIFTINIPSQIVVQTAAQWAADATVYSAKRFLVTSDVFYGSTDQRKIKLADGTQTWTNLDYIPISGFDDATSSIQTQLNATEKTANKNVALGYAGLSAAGKIAVSQIPLDTDGTLAANSDSLFATQKATKTYVDAVSTSLGNYQLLSGKDATGGYAGLTLFKINFKNVANTFTSFFTNSNTAARTYTFQDSDDTIVGRATTDTLTNKRITARTGTTASSATPTINTDNVDFYSITALAASITSFTTNLSGTPTEAQTLWIAITDNGTARAIAWGASFEASTVALPTTTVISARLDVGFIWNTVSSKWRVVGVA